MVYDVSKFPDNWQPISGRPTIGVLSYGMQHSICYDLWKGIDAVARTRDIRLLWFVGDQIRCPFGDFREQANIIYELVNPDTVDGLLIWGGALFPHLDTEEIQTFCARYHPLPIVCMSHVLPGIPSVVVGNYQGMRDALVHLIDIHGYRRIAFMRGPTNEGSEANERYRAYRDVLQTYNIHEDPNLVMLGNNEHLPATLAFRALLNERGLRPGIDFDAIAASNDVMALAIVRVLQESGIRVPQDVALVGFDDFGPARAVTPPLTTVRYSFGTLGRQAADLLLTMLAGEHAPEQMEVPLNVIVRQSCGCRDATVARAAVVSERPAKQSTSTAIVPKVVQQTDVMAAIQLTLGPETAIMDGISSVVGAFLTALHEKLPDHFLGVLQETLQQTIAAEHTVEIWQNVVSVIRQCYADCLSEPQDCLSVENLCQQARVIIAKTARRTQETKHLHIAEQERILRDIGARLLTTFEIDGLMDVLIEELPGLEIPACFITLYDSPSSYTYPQTVPEWSHMRLMYDIQQRTPVNKLPDHAGRFPTNRLLPAHVFPEERQVEYVIMPLYFREHQLGVMLFEGTPREGIVYHALRTEISSALQGALLVNQVQQNAIEVIRQKSILDTFMATVPDAIYFKDRHSRITQSNQSYAHLLGLDDPREILGKTDFDFFSDQQAHIRHEQEQQILRTRQPLLELEEPGSQGHWLLTTKMPLFDEHGDVVGTFGISRDITRLKLTEQELRRYRDHLGDLVKERTAELSQAVTQAEQLNQRLQAEVLERRRAEEDRRMGEEQYRMLAEHVKDGIVIVQHERLVFVNSALAEMLGMSKEELLQQEPFRLFPEYAHQPVSARQTSKNVDIDSPARQVEMVTGSGGIIWTEIEESSIVWNADQAVLLTVRNIHQTKLREMRLEEERARLRQENQTYRSAGPDRYRFGPLVGKSPVMQRVYELIVSAATSGVNVLISGESGTGKELIAQTIHQVSARKSQPFVPVNCASIPETLFEREFFGHRKGTFTGADRDKPGLFDRAHRGVLFLDEVTELAAGMQAKLLRVLQDGEYLPLGSTAIKQADVVIVAATNKDCRQEIIEGRLRQDFFYRIGVIEIQSPPLRRRKDDLPLLIEHVFEQYGQKHASPTRHAPLHVSELPGELMQALYAHEWPGNVRELQNILHRYLATHQLADILALLGSSNRTRSRLPESAATSADTTLDDAVSTLEKRMIRDMLAATRNNKSETARRLHITRRTLRLKIKKYELDG